MYVHIYIYINNRYIHIYILYIYIYILPRAKSLVNRMVSQGGNKPLILKQIKKAVSRHPEPFRKFSISTEQIIDNLS